MARQKVLIVTAREAEPIVRKYVKNSRIPVEVYVCSVDVAALLTPDVILKELSNLDLRGISMILVPGMLKGDVSIIEKGLGIPCFKGTKNASDLGFVLDRLYNGIKLSKKEPADDIIAEERRKYISREIKNAYRRKGEYTLRIGTQRPVYLGTGISHIVAEIPNAPLLSERELKKFAKYYDDSGASIVDIGMIAGNDNSENIPAIIEILRSVVDIPLSIDTLDENEILIAADSGIDLILSLDFTNYSVCNSIDVPAVIIPRDKDGKIPMSVEERISLIERMMKVLRRRGFDRIIVDPILEVPNFGFTRSLDVYIEFRKRYPRLPMLIGAGNITEMMDVDSIGINALLAAFASELSVDLIFTTEASRKTKGSVRELSSAVRMMYLSRKQGGPPKDLGLDLLRLKDKRDIDIIMDPRERGIKTIRVRGEREPELEDTEFRIYLTDRINAIFYKNKRPEMKFVGNQASQIYKEIIDRNLIKNLDHAAYLGKELTKAEIALKLGKNYIQDEELFIE